MYASINIWDWLIVAVLLIGAETLFPGAFLLWIGVAAASVSFVLLLFPDISLWIQCIIFACFSLLSIFISKKLIRKQGYSEGDSSLNNRGAQYIGNTFTLSKAIVNGRGKVRVEDTEWLASGPDLPQGTRVIVVGVEGTRLRVEKAPQDS